MRRLAQTLACLLAAGSLAASAAPTIQLATHQQPPLSFTRSDGSPDGLSVKVVDCVLRKMQRSFTLQFLPWPRAQQVVQNQQADGFFAATPSAERNGYAVLSDSILPYQRRWYLLKDNPQSPFSAEFKRQGRVATFLGSNMDDWLRAHDYQVSGDPVHSEQLLKMLLSHRIDAILGNQYVIDALIQQQGLQAQLRSELAENLPFGVYFGKAFLAREGAQFLPRFNAAIPACRP